MVTGTASLLSWVKTEIDFSLKVVREALAKAESDPGEARGLHVCPHQLHQVSGALRMLGLEGARQFCVATEGLLEGMVQSEPAAKAFNVAGRAIQALQEFTDAVAQGGANIPLKLFPIYREVAAQLGRGDTTEKDLFFPDVSIGPPDRPDRQTLPPDALREQARLQRTRFQRGLVAWIHKPDDPRGLHEMAAALDALDRLSPQLPEPRALWWVAAAMTDGLLHPPGAQWLASARVLCSKIDFQMRDLVKDPQRLNDGLLRDLLYVIAACPPNTPRLRDVKERYALDTLLPEPEVGLDFDMDWLQPALSDMRSRLETAKNTWVEYLGGEPQRLARFRELARALKVRAEELGSHHLVRLLDVVCLVATRLPDPYPAGTQAVMLEMATAFLLAESIVDSFTAPPDDLDQQVVLVNGWLLDAASGKASAIPPAGLRSDLVQQFNQTQLRAQVTKEIAANLQQIEETLDAYARDPARRETLPGLAPGLRQVRGALMVLGFADATALLDCCERLIAARASGEDTAPDTMDWIAEGLSALGLFLEPCLHGRAPEGAAMDGVLARLAEHARAEPEATPESEAGEVADAEPDDVESPAEPVALEITLKSIEEIVPATPPAPASAPAATPPAADVGDEMLDVFLEEANEVLAGIADALPVCREHNDDREALTTIRRGFHTLKGSGRMVGLNDLGEIAWAIEQVMNRWLEQRLPASPLLLQLIDDARIAFAGWVRKLEAREPLVPHADAILDLAARLKRGDVPAHEPAQEAAPQEAEAVDAAPVEAPLPEVEASAHAQAIEPEPAAAVPEMPAATEGIEAPAAPVEAAASAVEIAPAPEPEAEVRVGEVDVAAGLYEIYLKEAQQHVATLKTLAGQWCDLPGRIVPAACTRAAHTLAGISRTAGFEHMAALAAAMEQWMPHARHTSAAADVATVKAAVAALDAMLRHIERRVDPPAASALEAALHDIASRPAPVADTAAAHPAPVAAPADKPPVHDDIDPQLLPLFVEEALELLPLVGGDLRDWKVRPGDPNIPLSLKRTLHTLKGSARMAGAMRLGELAHLMESRIEAAEDAGDVGPALVAQLESELDRLSFGVDALAAPPDKGTPAPAPLVVTQPAAVRRVERQTPAATTAMLRISADTLDRLINDAGESSIARSRIEGEVRGIKGAIGELSDSVLRLRAQLRDMELQADSQLQSRATVETKRADFDPLEFDRYTRLQELARMMGETMHDIMSIQQTLMRTADETDVALLHQGRINRELQQELMSLRTVPFSSMTERLHRVVRQAAREVEKHAELDIRGDQVQLDRGVLERIAAPLEHLLRNAVAHGIELPAQREARGKPATGKITLTLRQENDAVVLVLQDDGAGLDLEKLRRRGIERGLLAPDSEPSAADVAQLVFASGLSTADTVTALAGRGVGMDVVRNEINATGGRIEIDSVSGTGTTFTVFLPLTLAVAQAVLVRAGEQLYAVSSASVIQVLRVKRADLETMYAQRRVEAHGQAYPLHYLGHLLGTVEQAPAVDGYSTVLLLRSGSHRAAVHVDELVRNQEVVIKNIGPQLARTTWIAGATVLGDGRVVLIVNAVQLAQRADAATQASPIVAPAAPAEAPRTVMVVDDSLTVRKITSRLLEREGYRVLAAKDGVDALEQVHRSVPDIMLVDIEMPRMDGFDLTRNLRGDPRTAAVPIIVISSRTADKHRTHAFELGVNDFIGKPYQEAELLAHIQKYLEPQPA